MKPFYSALIFPLFVSSPGLPAWATAQTAVPPQTESWRPMEPPHEVTVAVCDLRALPPDNLNTSYAFSPGHEPTRGDGIRLRTHPAAPLPRPSPRVAVPRAVIEPDAGGHVRPLPAPDSPFGAVLCLLQAYRDRDLETYAGMLSAHFFFDSSDPDFRAACPNGLTREDEIASADHLFHGFTNAAGVHLPAARSIQVTVDSLHYSRGHAPISWSEPMQVVVAEGVHLVVRLADGSSFETGPAWNVFFVERALADEVARGQPVDPSRWIVRLWLERPDGRELAAAPPPAQPAPPQAARRPVDSSLVVPPVALIQRRLAFLRAPNPARGPFRFLIEIPERGSASIEVFDVQGRRVSRSDLGEREPGDYSVPATTGVQLAPGFYWFRLTQGRRAVTTRIVILS